MTSELTEILPLAEWIGLAQEIQREFGVQTMVFDSRMKAILPPHGWENDVCMWIRADKENARFVCGASHKAMTAEAMTLRTPIASECNGGFLKVIYPLFHGEEFVGTISACGLILDEETGPDPDEIVRVTRRPTADVTGALARVRRVKRPDVDRLIRYIDTRLPSSLPTPAI